MLVGVPQETFPGERRVALVPADLPRLAKSGINVLLERGAGASAGYPDAAYTEKGAEFADSRDTLWQRADLVAAVRVLGADPPAHTHPRLLLVRVGELRADRPQSIDHVVRNVVDVGPPGRLRHL